MTDRRRHRSPRRLAQFVIGLLVLACLPASGNRTHFQIHDVWFSEFNDGYIMHSDMTVQFSEIMAETLHGGIALPFVFEIALMRQHDFWVDRRLVNLTWESNISYDSFQKRYRLTLDERDIAEYAELPQLVNTLQKLTSGRLYHPKFVEFLLDRRTYLRARFFLNIDLLPQPLQVDIITDPRSDYSSGWYRFDRRIEEQ